MPVRQIRLGTMRRPNERLEELRRRLIEEWQERGTVEPRPDIREELDRAGQHVVHVYVVWEEWQDLDHQRRSEVITDAFIEVKDEDAILYLTVAMGLTQAEAKRMGIE